MNDQLESQLVESASRLIGWAEGAGAFVNEQAPMIADEVIRLGMMSRIPWAACIVLFAVAACFCVRLAFSTSRQLRFATEPAYVEELGNTYWFAFIGSVVLSVLILAMLCEISWALEPYIAPRLYLLRQLRQLF